MVKGHTKTYHPHRPEIKRNNTQTAHNRISKQTPNHPLSRPDITGSAERDARLSPDAWLALAVAKICVLYCGRYVGSRVRTRGLAHHNQAEYVNIGV